MSALTEQRKSTLINIAYFAVIIAAFFLFMKYAFWLFSPFIFAFAVAVVLQKPVAAISKKIKLKKGLVSTVLLILFLFIVLAAVGFIGYSVYSEIVDFKNFIAAKLADLPALLESLHGIALRIVAVVPGRTGETATQAVEAAFTKMIDYAESGEEITGIMSLMGFSLADITSKFNIKGLANPVISTAMSVPSKLIAVLIFFIASFFLTLGYDGLAETAKKTLKKTTADKISTVKRITLHSLGQMGKSYAVIIGITFCEISLGLGLLKLIGVYTGAHIFTIAIFTAVVDILPVLGTGAVMIPWALYCLLISHQFGMALGLIIMYALITVLRQIIEPKLVGANLGIPPILTLMAMYIGLQTIGVIGMFVLPITIVVVVKLNEDGVIHLWGEKKKLATQESLPPDQEIIKPVMQRLQTALKRLNETSQNAESATKEDGAAQENGSQGEK
ncbi:MAG: sporulation integral membrane protein YtvI [Clostridia bacterium]|nr:sporulation integral membrane protein YtvI [Clostridia bacterium]